MAAEALPPEMFMMIIDQVYLDNTEQEGEYRQQEADREHRRSVGLPAETALAARRMPLNRTLAACALVCRSWLQRSRFVQFDSDWNPEGLSLELFQKVQALSDLATLLRSPLCTISPHVRHLELYSLSWGFRWDLMRLRKLYNVTYIALGDVRRYHGLSDEENSIQPKDIPAFLECFEQIYHLDLGDFKLESPEDLCDIICSCPGLYSLGLCDITAGDPDNIEQMARVPSSSALQPPTSLKMLTISDRCSFGEELFDWLATSKPAILLDKVDLNIQLLVDYPAAARFLERLGPGLKHLVINTNLIDEFDDENISPLNAAVNLGHNTGLCKLEFQHVGADSNDEIVLAALEQVRACNIEEIRIYLSRYRVEDIGEMQWNGIDSILARPNFAQLGGLYIMANKPDEESLQNWFKTTFPRSLSRGIAHLAKY